MLNRIKDVFKSLHRHDVAWASRVIMDYQGQEFFVVSREHLIASKQESGRPVDLDDVRMLTEPPGSQGL